MSHQPKKRRPFTVVWEFRVKSGRQRAFEKAYGAEGDWVRLFRSSQDYLGTELIRDRDTPGRYLTLDRWSSRSAYLRFKNKNRDAYQTIDAQCEVLTTSEKLIGEFDGLEKPRNLSFPKLFSQSGGQECPPHTAIGIRPATSSDIAGIMAVERASISAAHWPETAYRHMFSNEAPARIAFIAEGQGAELHGFVIARLAIDDCELENIAVSRKYLRRGLGIRLFQALIESARMQKARRIFLEVRESNAVARALYEKLGFAITGRRHAYYTGPVEDAILYALQL